MRPDEIDSMALSPLSAGDLLDRVVRLYRIHWIPLTRICAIPVILTFISTIAITIGFKNFSVDRGDFRVFAMSVLMVAGIVGYLISKAIFLMLLGGTSTQLIAYFRDGTEITFKGIIRSATAKAWRLLAAVFLSLVFVGVLFFIWYFLVFMMILVWFVGAGWVLSSLPAPVAYVFHALFFLTLLLILSVFGAMALKRTVFLIQVVAVEGKGVATALSRSLSLAGHEMSLKDVLPTATLGFFYLYISWSVLMMILIPVDGFGWMHGIDITPFVGQQPLWYSIASSTLSQLCDIVLEPILLIGFIMIYIDSRVRREGFDLELMADRYLPSKHISIPHGAFPMELPKSFNPAQGPPSDDDTPTIGSFYQGITG